MKTCQKCGTEFAGHECPKCEICKVCGGDMVNHICTVCGSRIFKFSDEINFPQYTTCSICSGNRGRFKKQKDKTEISICYDCAVKKRDEEHKRFFHVPETSKFKTKGEALEYNFLSEIERAKFNGESRDVIEAFEEKLSAATELILKDLRQLSNPEVTFQD